MIKKEIYPKTKRVKVIGDKLTVTEKLDGSNLVIFKKDNEIHIAQRNNIFTYNEIEEQKGMMYKGLYQWLKDNIETLQNELIENSAICGEWLGMGQIKYFVDEFDKRFYMFAKANVTDEYELTNLFYDHNLFIYPFVSQKIPSFIGVVPKVCELNVLPTKAHLDSIYEKYTNKVNRNVEGFVVNYNNIISKYVRMKNGKMKEHFDREKENE